MLLSIGMIVKNEERYLRRCLDAIQPILERVDSELIIADTGSTDATVDIARLFTEKIHAFEWCDDFSAARNSVLEKARGKWFMSLDADEVFNDINEIIDFFNTGEYKKYKSATYIIRNSNKEDLSTFSDFDALRLGLIEGDTRYVNRIHEVRPYYEPTKKLGSVAIHYGYISEGNSEFIAMKTQRNLDMLLSELEENPKKCRTYLQIGQSYCLRGDFRPGLEYLEKGLQYAKEQQDGLLFPLYGDIARVYFVTKKYSDVLRITQEYFRMKKNKSEIDLQMYFLEGSCYAKEAKHPEAIFALNRYLELYKEYQRKSSRTSDSTQYLVNFTDIYNYRIACLNLANVYVHDKDYPAAGSILKRIPISDWAQKDTYQTRLEVELEYMAAAEDFSQLPELFKQLDSDFLKFLQTSIEKLLENEQKRNLILAAVAGSDLPPDNYTDLLKLRSDYYCDNSITETKIQSYADQIREWVPPYTDVVYFALQRNPDISYLSSKVNAFDLQQLLLAGAFQRFADMPGLACRILEERGPSNAAGVALWLSFFAMWALPSDQLDSEQAIKLFRNYVGVTDGFLNAAYRDDFLAEGNSGLLPFPLRIGFYCSLAVKALERGDKSKYIEYLKIVIHLYPGFKKVIENLLDELQQSLESTSKPNDALSELEQYAAVVKTNIGKLIDSGQTNQAAELLYSYEQLCPSDPEITDLNNRIKQGINN